MWVDPGPNRSGSGAACRYSLSTVNLIDAHVHLYPPEINRDPAGWAAAAREPHWATLCTRRRRDGQPVQTFPSVDDLLRALDRASVARAVLLGWYWETPAACHLQNTFYAACVRAHPDRLLAFATFHPAAGETGVRTELQRAADAGLCGLGELSPHSAGFGLDDPAFVAALEFAAAQRWPVNLHVTDPDSRDFPGRVATPLDDFVHFAARHPAVAFILAHWGGLLPLRHSGPLPPNLYYDTAASPLLYGQDIWRRFCATVPAERVLFGSDHPLNLYPRIDPLPALERLVAEVHRSELDAAALRAIVRDNARRLLRLP